MSSTKPAAAAAHAHAHAHSHKDEKGTSLQTELTSSLQFDGAGSLPASPTLEDHQEHPYLHQTDTFTFPTLKSDGSLADLREASTCSRDHAPPAALNPLGAKARMAGNTKMDYSTDSLVDDSYDMVEDASEMTNDDCETASLASTEDAMSDEDGEMTPDEDDENVIKFNAGSVGDLASTPFSGTRQQSTEDDNRVMDSYMSDDLETPRQSTIHPSLGMPAPYTTTSNSPSSTDKADPVSIRVVLYCSEDLDSPTLASKVAARIAASIGSTKEECQTFELPPTPDNTVGSVIARHGNIFVTVDRVDASASELELSALMQRSQPNLVILHLSDVAEYPPACIKGIYATNDCSFKTLVVVRRNESTSPTDNLYGPDMAIDEQDFFADVPKTSSGLRRLMGGVLPVDGKQSRRAKKSKKTKIHKQELSPWINADSGLMRMALGALMLALIAPAFFTYTFLASPVAISLKDKQMALSSSLSDWLGEPVTPDTVPEMFAPELDPALRSMSGKFTILLPNHVVLAVIDKDGKPGSDITHVDVLRPDGREIDYNLTTLADGFFGFALPVEMMYGTITLNVTMKKPAASLPLTHDFGSPLWHRSTYQKASTDLTKAINKDVAVARKAAKSLTDRVGLEVSAGVAATHNVTTQLAVRMTREIAVLANHTTGVFSKVASKGIGTAKQISKEIAVVRKDLIRCVDDVKKSVATTAHTIRDLIVPSRKSFTSPLKSSRQRAVGFKEAISGRRAKVQKGESSLSKGVGAQRDNIFSGFGKYGGAEKNNKCGKCKAKEKCKGCL